MATKDRRWSRESDQKLSRRDVLSLAAGASIVVATRSVAAAANDDNPTTTQPASEASRSKPWWLVGPDHVRSRVIDTHSKHVLNASVADKLALTELIIHGVQSLTLTDNPVDAWQAILGPAKRIVLKFNGVGAPQINTTDAMARALIEALDAGNYPAGNIALVEVPEHLETQLKTRAAPRGWGAAIAIGSEKDDLANYVYDADAIINVPFLKTHKIAGMTCCLKNLSHAVVRHPARYHQNRCSPYVGQIVGSGAITKRLKLNIVNAIRTVVDNGPDATERDIYAHGGILLGYDPVATDAVALDILLRQRRELGLAGRLDVPYLDDARQRGVGRMRVTEIDRMVLEVGK